MSTLTEGRRALAFLLDEFSEQYCREKGTLVMGQNLAAGTVVMDNGSGKLTAYTAGEVTEGGTDEAAGILTHAADATDADVEVTYIARGPATVKLSELTSPEGTDEDANTIASLALLNPPIIVRS